MFARAVTISSCSNRAAPLLLRSSSLLGLFLPEVEVGARVAGASPSIVGEWVGGEEP